MVNALRFIAMGLERIAAAIIVVLLAAMVLVVLSQFVDRYLTPIWGGVPADEYVKVALVWLTFLGFALATRAGAEIRVDIADQHVPERVRRVVYGVFDVVLLGMLGVIVWKSIQLARIGLLQTILGTDMTLAVPVTGMLAGCVLLFLAILARLLQRAFGVRI
jgi:TRAP-type C4-dicarboxylate transport system permease small subunit